MGEKPDVDGVVLKARRDVLKDGPGRFAGGLGVPIAYVAPGGKPPGPV
jgi:hypothetical protein